MGDHVSVEGWKPVTRALTLLSPCLLRQCIEVQAATAGRVGRGLRSRQNKEAEAQGRRAGRRGRQHLPAGVAAKGVGRQRGHRQRPRRRPARREGQGARPAWRREGASVDSKLLARRRPRSWAGPGPGPGPGTSGPRPVKLVSRSRMSPCHIFFPHTTLRRAVEASGTESMAACTCQRCAIEHRGMQGRATAVK